MDVDRERERERGKRTVVEVGDSVLGAHIFCREESVEE